MGESESDEPVVDERERRRAAKLSNERLKLIAALLTNAGVAIFVVGSLAPFVAGVVEYPVRTFATGFALLLVLHGMAHAVLLLWRSEE